MRALTLWAVTLEVPNYQAMEIYDKELYQQSCQAGIIALLLIFPIVIFLGWNGISVWFKMEKNKDKMIRVEEEQ